MISTQRHKDAKKKDSKFFAPLRLCVKMFANNLVFTRLIILLLISIHTQAQEKDAKTIARAKQNDLRKYGKLSSYAWFWNWFLDFTIGHGYQVWRILIFACSIIGIGAFVFYIANYMGVMVPVKDAATKTPFFQPIIYSIDLFLPIVNLHEEEYWLPMGQGKFSNFFMGYLWVHIFLGWLLTTIGVAGLTGIVKKD